jgi:isopentenyl-diphosphate delta-isomerase
VRPEVAETYAVRPVAPEVALVGNIGLGQVISLGVDAVRALADAIGADGMAVHLNVAQELAQREGDRAFRGGLKAIEALARAFGPRLLVKETGCGIGPDLCARLVEHGVRNIDVSGAGGTSWVQVELLRGGRAAAAPYAPWGIPTAAAIGAAYRRVGGRCTLVASGGIRDGLHAAKALALGADLVGIALPAFRAQWNGGDDEADGVIGAMIEGLRIGMILTGSRTVAELRAAPRVITGPLKDWMEIG